ERTDHGGTATLTIVFKSSDPAGRQTARALPVDQLDAYTVPRLDRTVLDDINRKIARRYAGAWLAGEEPPAPAVRRPRAPKAPEELKATAHQLRTLEREADALDAGPLKEEAGVFQATPGTSAAASDLIERVTAQVAAQRKRHFDRQRYAGGISERVSVTGTVIRRRSGSWGVLLVVQDDAEEVRALAVARTTARALCCVPTRPCGRPVQRPPRALPGRAGTPPRPTHMHLPARTQQTWHVACQWW